MIKIIPLLLALALPGTPERLAVAKGEPAPAEGVWLSLPEVGRIVLACKKAEDERDGLRKIILEQREEGFSTEALVVSTSIGIALGIGLGAYLHAKIGK